MSRSKRFLGQLAAASLILLAMAAPLSAGHRHHRHAAAYGPGGLGCDCGAGACAAPIDCAPQVMTKTIMVPHTEYRTKTVTEVVCRPEVRQRTIPVTRMVPETTMVTRSFTKMVPEHRTRTEHYTVCRMERDVVEETATIQVPYTEMLQGVRTVCKPVLVTEYETVCRDAGHFESRTVTDCAGCAKTCRVWVPSVVKEQVPVQVLRPQLVEEAYEYPVTLCREETRHFTRTVARPVYEERTREVPYTVAVPQVVEREVPHTVMRPVVEEKVVSYTEMVPQTVERVITVPVCTLVPKEVTYTVGGCGACSECGGKFGPGGY